jgi:hypothetical protein
MFALWKVKQLSGGQEMEVEVEVEVEMVVGSSTQFVTNGE